MLHLSLWDSVNETTLDSFVSEDVGEMCTSELKSNGAPSQGVSFENSPTERLQNKPNESSSWENSPRETPRIDNLVSSRDLFVITHLFTVDRKCT